MTAGSQPEQRLYLPTLDGLRFVAFLLVFIHHLAPSELAPLKVLHDIGYVGVCVFLALSAYLLTRILAAEQEKLGRISIKNFFIRRSLRIWPLYFAFVIPLGLWACTRPDATARTWLRFGGLLTFLDDLFCSLMNFNPIPFVSHLWTVALEEQFYLVLPFVLAAWLVNTAKLRRIIVGTWLAFVVLRVVCVALKLRHPFIWTSPLSGDPILAGMLVALAGGVWPRSLGARIALVLFGLACIGTVALLPDITTVGWHHVVLFLQVGIGTGILCLSVVHDGWWQFLAWAPLRYLGKISYGLYVFHLLGIDLAARLKLESWWLSSAAALAVTVAMSVLSYEVFEKRFLELKRRFESIQTRQA